MTSPDDDRGPDPDTSIDDDQQANLRLLQAAAGFRAVLAAAGCVGLPSLADFLD